MKLEEKKLSSEEIYKGKLLHVQKDTVELPNGHQSTRELIRHQGAVVILPLFEDGRILLEKQFRYAPNEIFIELPAGKVDPGEDGLTTGKRELLEETGYEAKTWTFLANIFPAIGYADEKMDLYLAQDLTYRGHQRDEDEFLETFTVTLDEAMELIISNQIGDAKTAVGLFWAEKIIKKYWTFEDEE
jgi:ADP-ribose pyrophosphatase